ncbi:MAG: DUF3606 domain-containing protein [Bacteriovoracia bacterium]
MSRFKVFTGQGDGIGASAYYKEARPGVIDVNNEESLAQWEKSLQLTRKELLQAIAVHGPVGRDIRRAMAKEKKAS